MLWIAVFHPNLPLDLAYRQWPESLTTTLRDTVPLVVIEGRRVRWVNPCAADQGVSVGMTDTGAQALVANLTLHRRDPDAELAALTEAAMWALHFTPEVALRPPGLLLDVTASLRLFGGVHAIIDALRSGLAELGLSPCICAAPTVTAAWWLAQVDDGVVVTGESSLDSLDALPVSLVDALASHADTLVAIGCHTIGQLRRLPRQGLAKRFGRETLTELDRAFGAEPELMSWYVPPEKFAQRVELAARVETTELLLVSAKRLLMQLTGYLTARHCAVTRFSLLLHHEALRRGKSPTTTVEIAMGASSRDLAHLTLLMQEHLNKVQLQSSVIEMTLCAGELESLAAPNTELFPTQASDAESTGRLIERLSSRLGDKAVTRLAIAGDHRPECCSVPLPTSTKQRNAHAIAGSAFPPRPTWLLKTPISLLTRQNKPFYQSPLHLLIGPERIETGWWDDHLIARDYFVAINDAHMLLWIYRERVGAAEAEPGWFLHGLYA
jgi:protein ImuB